MDYLAVPFISRKGLGEGRGRGWFTLQQASAEELKTGTLTLWHHQGCVCEDLVKDNENCQVSASANENPMYLYLSSLIYEIYHFLIGRNSERHIVYCDYQTILYFSNYLMSII